MKITAMSLQVRDKNRVNIFVDGSYLFSLDASQVIDLGLKVGQEYDESQLNNLKSESEFGRVYQRSLEYCLTRPHSKKELRDYLFKKTLSKLDKLGNLKPGVSKDIVDRVFDRLVDRGYLDDEIFATFWVENRFIKKGISRRRLEMELIKKGIDRTVIENVINNNPRNDNSELAKVINKKFNKYDDKGLTMYLIRQGYNYDDVKKAIENYKDIA